MDNGLIVISSDGSVTEKKMGDSGYHAELLREYLEEKDLTYSNYLNDMGYDISCYLASVSEISVHAEGGIYIYFLGEKITDKQYEYFKNNSDNLKKHQTAFANMENGEFKFYDEYLYPDGNMFDVMMEKIEEKEIVSTVDLKTEKEK